MLLSDHSLKKNFYFLAISVYTACESSCEQVNTYCSAVFLMTGQSALLPNCSTAVASTGYSLQPDGACNNIPTKSM